MQTQSTWKQPFRWPHRRHLEILQVLLECNADANLIGGEFHTALRAVSSVGPKRNIRLLRDKNGNIRINAYFAHGHGWYDENFHKFQG